MTRRVRFVAAMLILGYGPPRALERLWNAADSVRRSEAAKKGKRRVLRPRRPPTGGLDG